MKRMAIIGGHIIDPATNTDAIENLYITDGRIIAQGIAPEGFQAEQTIDAHNLIVCPGLVDLQANIFSLGDDTTKLQNQLNTATQAGVTTLCCAPSRGGRSLTPIESEWFAKTVHALGKVRICQLGALTQGLAGQQLAELAALKEVGCIGVTNGRAPIQNIQIKRRCYEYAATVGMKVFIYPEDPGLAQNGCAHEGVISTRLGLTGIPALAETIALAQELLLINEVGIDAHFCRLSTEQSIFLLQLAKEQRLAVTADVAIQQLYLTENDISDFNSICHVRPPLRTETDRKGLQFALLHDVITAICSDHTPVSKLAKTVPFPETEPGMASLPALLPLTLRLVGELNIPLSQGLAWITHKPAEILGISPGKLSVGSQADICIFNAKNEWSLQDNNTNCQNNWNSPFLNWRFRGGQVHYTIMNGEVVYQKK
jgi:dihydroorotase